MGESFLALVKEVVLISDSCILTEEVWYDHLFGYTAERVLEVRKTKKYDFYLLMDIDLPWVDDPLRDFPDKRDHFLEVWKKELAEVSAQYRLNSGLNEERFENGIKAVKDFLKRNRATFSE